MFSLWLLLNNAIWRLILAIAYNKQIVSLVAARWDARYFLVNPNSHFHYLRKEAYLNGT